MTFVYIFHISGAKIQKADVSFCNFFLCLSFILLLFELFRGKKGTLSETLMTAEEVFDETPCGCALSERREEEILGVTKSVD